MPRRRDGSVEYWINAVREAGNAGREVAIAASLLWARLKDKIKDELDNLISIPSGGLRELYQSDGLVARLYNNYKNMRVHGVDSSRTKPIRIGFRYISFISASSVEATPTGESRVSFLKVEPLLLPEEAELEHASLELIVKMFKLEAEALEKISRDSNGPLFIDGPIVDPPNLSRSVRGDPGLEEEFERGLDRRARGIAKALDRGRLVVGFVKRVTGRSYTQSIASERGWDWLGGVNDSFLALGLALEFKRILEPMGTCKPGVVVVSQPVPLDPSRAVDAKLLEDRIREFYGGDVGVYTSLIVPGVCQGNTRKPARIEFLASKNDNPSEIGLMAASAVEAWIVPGAWIPSPVLLAHKSCTIRRRESLKLLREVTSRFAREALRREVLDLSEIFY